MRKLAKLVIVDDVKVHPNADALELAIVGGWQVCVKKGEFVKGMVGMYFEIDSMLPLDNEQFAFLAGRNEREVNGKKYARIKTMKLRKELSQGLLLPVPVVDPKLTEMLDNHFCNTSDADDLISLLNELVDFSVRLGVIKYEPKESSAVLSGLAKGNFPAFIPKTDQERYQNIRRQYEESLVSGQEFELSVKLDGSSFTAYVFRDSEDNVVTGVCSRNLELKLDQEGNAFVDLFKKLDLDTVLRAYQARTGNFIAIQGEMVGPGIQKNFEGVQENTLYVYNVFDITEQKYLLPSEARRIVAELGLNYVPVLDEVAKLVPYDEVQSVASGPSGLNGKFREGVVYKAVDKDFSFKCVSNEYLLKEE